MKVAVTRGVRVGGVTLGGGGPLAIIAGPCAIEDAETTLLTARRLKVVCSALGLPLVFKSSYDKANRTSIRSPRGPGLQEGLRILSEVKVELGLPVLSDVHSVDQVAPASEVLDVIQIPAFLSRQTDLIVAASKSGRAVNIKKGQFLAPWDVRNIIEKIRSTGCEDIMITERGTFFGYNNLVVDFRGIPQMRSYGYPVVFDVTHSLQQPGGRGDSTGGQREFAEPLLKAAVAVGVDALFLEVHPEPNRAISDAANMIPLDKVRGMLEVAKALHGLGRAAAGKEEAGDARPDSA
jgi:2-dehydro-3-deoxyphosphooctonate aldolase (KDO 8-P synthase)